MSMLGTSFLREIVVKEYMTNPAIILKRLRKEIIGALKQKGDYGEQKDGMDMAIVVINTENLEMQYAGANNPLYIIPKNPESLSNLPHAHRWEEKGEKHVSSSLHTRPTDAHDHSTTNAFFELKPDKMPVAIYEHMSGFTNHDVQLHKGDCLYLMSDGYQDQFGGPKKKKFLSKKLKELLKVNSHLHMNVQKELLEKTHLEWKGNVEQIDDITVLGIRI